MKTTSQIKTQIYFVFFLCICFCLPDNVFAQRKFKNYLITGSSMLVSGMIDGTIESISYHYDNGFKPRFSHINDQFWNPALSWRNKYKNGNSDLGPKFLGSTDIFVFTTDAYHMLRTANRAVGAMTFAYYLNNTVPEVKSRTISKRKKIKNIVTDFFCLTAIRCIGFNLTYSVLFKVQKN